MSPVRSTIAPSAPDGALAEASPGRLPAEAPVAVIDIGSNSVRLVVYEGLRRHPTPLYNEKTLCGLGEAIASTGRLSDAAIARATGALRRYRALATRNGVSSLHVVATAAVREAANGQDFVAEIERICGAQVEILSGRREAELAAFGVVSGIWRPDGLAGDLGGGSLELVDVRGSEIGQGITLPLGGLRLQDVSGKSVKRAAALVAEAFADTSLLEQGAGRDFYAIGGTWRSLGRLHMFQTNYPLHVMHAYSMPARQAGEFARLVATTAPETLAEIDAVSEARRHLLAYGALVLDEIVHRAKPSRVVFSAVGVREGLLYGLLDPDVRAADPLIAASAEFAYLRSRSPRHAEELLPWTDVLFSSAGLKETDDDRRLRHAACLLSDIGWRAHPDYRGEQSLNVIAHAGLVGVTHAERAFLALAIYYRHVGLGNRSSPRIRELCSPRMLERARILGAAFRVASVIAASHEGIVPHTPLQARGGKLVLRLPGAFADLNGRRVQTRLKTLAKVLGLDAEIKA